MEEKLEGDFVAEGKLGPESTPFSQKESKGINRHNAWAIQRTKKNPFVMAVPQKGRRPSAAGRCFRKRINYRK